MIAGRRPQGERALTGAERETNAGCLVLRWTKLGVNSD
jgi:hypothetical protein